MEDMPSGGALLAGLEVDGMDDLVRGRCARG